MAECEFAASVIAGVPSSDCRGGSGARELSCIAAIVLAGGEGRRMGGDKPLRRFGAHSLLDSAMEIARRHGGPTAIGVRCAAQTRIVGDAAVVFDAPGVEGPLASLLAGLAWAARMRALFLLTLPCDAPFLPHDLAQRLHRRLWRSGALAALPRSAVQLHPACALWSVDALEKAPAYINTRRTSLRGFAEHAGFTVEDWGALTPDPFFNINTPDDLARAERLIAQPHLE